MRTIKFWPTQERVSRQRRGAEKFSNFVCRGKTLTPIWFRRSYRHRYCCYCCSNRGCPSTRAVFKVSKYLEGFQTLMVPCFMELGHIDVFGKSWERGPFFCLAPPSLFSSFWKLFLSFLEPETVAPCCQIGNVEKDSTFHRLLLLFKRRASFTQLHNNKH